MSEQKQYFCPVCGEVLFVPPPSIDAPFSMSVINDYCMVFRCYNKCRKYFTEANLERIRVGREEIKRAETRFIGVVEAVAEMVSKNAGKSFLEEEEDFVDLSWRQARSIMGMGKNVARESTFCDKFYYLYKGRVVCVFRSRVQNLLFDYVTQEDKDACDWRLSP